jgi:hypothetical protein
MVNCRPYKSIVDLTNGLSLTEANGAGMRSRGCEGATLHERLPIPRALPLRRRQGLARRQSVIASLLCCVVLAGCSSTTASPEFSCGTLSRLIREQGTVAALIPAAVRRSEDRALDAVSVSQVQLGGLPVDVIMDGHESRRNIESAVERLARTRAPIRQAATICLNRLAELPPPSCETLAEDLSRRAEAVDLIINQARSAGDIGRRVQSAAERAARSGADPVDANLLSDLQSATDPFRGPLPIPVSGLGTCVAEAQERFEESKSTGRRIREALGAASGAAFEFLIFAALVLVFSVGVLWALADVVRRTTTALGMRVPAFIAKVPPLDDGKASNHGSPRKGRKKQQLSWRQAELHVAAWAQAQGWPEVQVAGTGADGGVDVESRNAVVQVKMQSARVGRPVVQKIYGIGASRGKQPVAVSGSGFTATAIEWASEHGVILYELDRHGAMRRIR